MEREHPEVLRGRQRRAARMQADRIINAVNEARREQAEANLNVPPGVRGDQRAAYLALTDEQKRGE